MHASSCPTLSEYFERHYRPEAMVDCRPASIADARRAVESLRESIGTDVRIDRLTDSAVATLLSALRAEGKSAPTVNRYRANLVAISNHAYNAGLVDRPLRVKKLREIRNPPRAWTVNELRQILAAARMFRQGWSYGKSHGGRIRCDLFWEALLLVAYETALRRGSLLAIRQSDVDLESGWLVVDGSSSKTLKGQSFKLSTETVAALRRIWKPTRKLVFAYASLREINTHFGLILKASGAPRGGRKGMSKFHMIRRTSATIVCATAGITAAASLLGHSSAEVTRRNYVDPTQLKHDVTGVLPGLSQSEPRIAAAG